MPDLITQLNVETSRNPDYSTQLHKGLMDLLRQNYTTADPKMLFSCVVLS